jgi:hypothetical protein
MRKIYKLLLRIHPPAFRRRFAEEMLWIFDETAPSSGTPGMLADVFLSLARQWVLRSGSWKLAVAMVGAAAQVTAGGLIWIAFARLPVLPDDNADPAVGSLIRLILWSTGPIALMVAVASLWVRGFLQTRNHRS